ncbi:MAG: SCO family protein [Acidobacteria bacterium]|nr:MAG: SCO family protein [Acidobacteriota bacterium]
MMKHTGLAPAYSRNSRLRFAWAFATLCVLSFRCTRPARPDIPVYFAVPDFSLIERSGKTVTLRDLAGKVWVADFIFTNCGGTCPLMTEKMRKLQDVLPPGIHMVSITVDPSRDTVDVLADYARKYGADDDRWLFLTGEKQALYELSVKGFKLALDDTSGTAAEPITHSTRFVLVDQKGMIRGYYSGTEDEELKRLSSEAKKLL